MRFEYQEPKTIEEAISLLAEYDGRAKIIAGGTDLMPQIRDRKLSPEVVLDLGGIPGLDGVACNKDKGLTIGALTRIRDIETSAVLKEHVPILSQAAGQLGSVGIRNVGTIGGNLCNAAPSAETAPALLTLEAVAAIAGPGGQRRIPLETFFSGPGATVLAPGEVLVSIHVPLPPDGSRGLYLKHGMRGTIDLAMVGVAVVVAFAPDGSTCNDIRIALGAVAPTPIRARSAEAVLKGKKMDDSLIEQSAKAAAKDSSCISDVRASAEYRREMVEVFTRRALTGVMTA